MGIPLSGLGIVESNETLGQYQPDPETCWINRGDPVVKYRFRFFQTESAPRLALFQDPMRTQTYEILSPVSGLHLAMRKEETVRFTYGLQYQWESEPLLPIVLVPNDEPPPDTHNFYVYDGIAQLLSDCFNRLPIRDHNNTAPERLRDWLDRNGDKERTEFYGYLRKLRERTANDFRSYEIREISDADTELIQNIQKLRTKNLDLRQKLVHLARRFGETIGKAHPATERTVRSTKKYDVALSFAGENRSIAEQLAEMLRQAEFRVFYDKYEEAELWGKDLYTHLSDVYSNESTYCVMFISQHYSAKLWTNHERKAAQARAFRESKEYILPVRLDDTELPGLQNTIGYLDLRKGGIKEVSERLSQKLIESKKV